MADARSRGQRLAAVIVSVWTLWWIGGQFFAEETAPSAIEVLGDMLRRLGVTDASWASRVAGAWEEAGPVLAVLGGLSWAATTEHGQAPALFGWVLAMLASVHLGYRPAILIALAAMVGFVLLLWTLSFVGGHFVDRGPRLLPQDVFRAGVTAATLSAVVPLFAPGCLVYRLLDPYLTSSPRPLPSFWAGGDKPTVGGWSRLPQQTGTHTPDRTGESDSFGDGS